jgi:hypothetical protein
MWWAFYHATMKTALAIWIGFAVVASAQTNAALTNAIVQKTNTTIRGQPVVVTKAIVLQGLTTISNEISEATFSLQQLDVQHKDEQKRLALVRASGQGGNMDADDTYLENKYGPPEKLIRQKIAVLKLQEFDIRKRYAALLK